ncbi:MAG: prepilin-type N-terminal cleavage/methylation domain-containing protein [Chthonomonadales bacterium]
MVTSINRKRRGFTLIELLVVVLILAILMSVALPLYLSAVGDSQKKVCRANLQTIANAVQANYVSSRPADYSGFYGAVSTTLEPDLSAVPKCPTGGTYSVEQGAALTNLSFRAKCTTHGTYEPGVDSQ